MTRETRRTIPTHRHAGKWYEHNGSLRYHPRFPQVIDDEALNSDTMRCLYAGYKIIDTLDEREVDVSADDRWQAVRSEKLGKGDTFVARTKSLVLELVDRHWAWIGPRTYVAGCALRHETKQAQGKQI